MSLIDNYSKNYEEARQRFCDAAAQADAKVEDIIKSEITAAGIPNFFLRS